MSNYNSLKTTIDANIKQNGRQEITGQILNSVLNQMVTTLGTGYQFAGVATIDTNPGTPDAKVFYIANGKGTYTNFGGIEVTEDDVVVLYWDSSWHKESTGIASNEKLSELGQVLGKRYIKKIFPSLEERTTYNLGFTLNPNTTYYVYLKGGDNFIALYYNGISQGQHSFLKKDNIIIITTGSEPNGAQIYSNNTISSSVEIIFSLETGFQDIISSIKGDINSIKGDINSIEGDINSILTTEKNILSLTTTAGYYINLNGVKMPVGGAIISSPILLTQNDKLTISANGNSAVTFLAKTNEEGSTYQPIVIGSGPTSTATNQTKTYTIEETGYYAFCSLNSYLEVYIEQITGGIIKYILDEISSLIPTIPEQEYSISMFEKVACCGDSYVIGQIYNSEGLVGDKPNLSWGKNIGRLEGIEINIYASSGADTNTWQTRSTCLPAALAAQPSGLYIFCMGINDTAYVTKGSMSDITNYDDYHDYPNTFYGNYGKIIEQIKAHAPNSKIIIMTPCHPSYVANWLTPITEITEYYGIAMINTLESDFINSSEFTSRLMGGHPTAALHGALAIEIIKLVSNCINNNYNYFKDYVV